MRIRTWRTDQPADHERFYMALKAVFEKLGPAISFDDFHQTMTDFAEAYPPHLN